MEEDERRIHMDQMMEMDGTTPNGRQTWYVGSGDSAGPGNRRKAGSAGVARKDEEDNIRQGVLLRKSDEVEARQEFAAFNFVDKDVSDTEEGAEHELEETIDRRHDDIRRSTLKVPGQDGDSDVSTEQGTLAGNSSNTPIASSPTAPSPILNAQDKSFPPAQEQLREAITTSKRAQPRTRVQRAPVAPARVEDRHSELYYTIDEENASEQARRVDTTGRDTPASHEPVSLGYSAFGNNPHTPSTPRTNGRASPAVNGHIASQSITKTTPPQRQLSSRRSPSITTQIPFNKERVRYSWQSVQDEEPNRPRIHIIKLVSNTATESAGFPQSEAFGFSISPAGRRIAAFNSARLYILQTAALPVGVSQDYALKRRPLAVEILDEGNLIAILADQHTVNLYDLHRQSMVIVRSIKLDFPTDCIALAPTGGLLAAAYEGGIEVFSLDANAMPTDRRAVRSVKMNRMTFSEDGSTILGTTTRINVSSTVTVSVPVFPSAASNVPTHEELKEAWCSELLHPENIRNSSHAVFMRENRATCNDRLFAWNGLADTFGILNVNDMQYGNIDFPVVISPPLSTCGGLGAAIHSCPAIDEHGDTVAMIVNDRTIRLYIVPHKADQDETSVEAHSIDHELDAGYGCPFSEVRWVYSSAALPSPTSHQTQVQGRLLVTSPGGVADPNLAEEMVDDVEGGRIILFDFDPQFAGQAGQTFSLTLGRNPPQLLEEPQVDVAQEVALVRRRTVNQSKGGGLAQRPLTLGRAASTFGGRRDRPPSRGGETPARAVAVTERQRRSMLSLSSLNSEASRSLPDLTETDEGFDTFVDEPYAQNAPRSHASLQRAATNAQKHRFQTIEERNQARISVDSTGGFLTLPEYTEEPNAPLPSRFRAMAGLDTPGQAPGKASVVTNSNGDHVSPDSSEPSTAPAKLGEDFSPEEAFGAAMDEQMRRPAPKQQAAPPSRDEALTPISSRDDASATLSPVARDDASHTLQRTNTFESLRSMPRSLQRAYGNAGYGQGRPPNLIGDWENVSPVTRSNTGGIVPPRLQSSALSNDRSTVPEDEAWENISPVHGTNSTSSTVDANEQNISNEPQSERSVQTPVRGSSSGSSQATPTSPYSATPTGRRLPPHMQFIRRAAANNTAASASLFPPSQATDHVPLRQPAPKVGTVAHPITAWHPPAAASTPNLSGAPGITRSQSQRSSIGDHSEFVSTSRGKHIFSKSGRRRKKKPFNPDFDHPGGRGLESRGRSASMFESKSIFTSFTRGEGKCVVM